MRELIGPVVGGIALIQEVPDALEITTAGGAAWTSDRADDQIRVVHRVGTPDRDLGQRLVSAPPPMNGCWVDPRGHLALTNDAPDGSGDQVLRTEVDGYRYVLTHESVAAARFYQWLWQRAIFSYAVASRGAGLVAHATGLRLADGRTVLCPGISGTGKSTIARLVADHAPERATVLCDDRVFLRRDADGASLWGTPWHSAANTFDPSGGPLAGIVLLRRGPGAELRPLGAAHATPQLLRTMALPFWSDGHLAAALGFLSETLQHAPVYEFAYAPSEAAVEVLLDAFTSGAASRPALAEGAR